MLDHYPTAEELRMAKDNYSMGRDSCLDREILSVAGGPMYQHLSGCGCQSDFLGGALGSIFGGSWPW